MHRKGLLFDTMALRRLRHSRLLATVALLLLLAPVATLAANASGKGSDGGTREAVQRVMQDLGEKKDEPGGARGLVDGLAHSFTMILVSELGDETFIIAAILAMRNPRWTVLMGSLSALAIMTCLSTALGMMAPLLVTRDKVSRFAVMLYTFFGLRLLYLGFKQSSKDSTEQEVEEVEDKLSAETDKIHKSGPRAFLSRICTRIFAEAFVLTFLAEWGDRSQITTIALGAHKNPFAVTIGAIAGHAFCTGLAVVGGRILALRISQRAVAITGGFLFIFFAAQAFFFGAPGT